MGVAARGIAAAALAVLLAGCAGLGAGGLKAANDGLLVFGAQLGATGIPVGLAGAAAEETPCLNGRDLAYDAQDILIGYTHGGRIRKVVTRNPDTSVYGIRPGEDFASAGAKVLAAGFWETGAKHRYRSKCCLLTLSVDEAGRVFNLLLELGD